MSSSSNIKNFLIGVQFAINQSTLDRFKSAIRDASTEANLLAGALKAGALAIVNGAAEIASALEKTYVFSQVVNSSVPSIEKFRYVFIQMGGTISEANRALESFGKLIQDNEPGYTQVVKALGIATTDSAGKIRDTTEIALDLYRKLSSLEPIIAKPWEDLLHLPDTERRILHRPGNRERMEEDLKEVEARQKTYGITDEAGKKAQEFMRLIRSTWDEVDKIFTHLETGIITELLPHLEKIKKWMEDNRPSFVNINVYIREMFHTWADGADFALTEFGKLITALDLHWPVALKAATAAWILAIGTMSMVFKGSPLGRMFAILGMGYTAYEMFQQFQEQGGLGGTRPQLQRWFGITPTGTAATGPQSSTPPSTVTPSASQDAYERFRREHPGLNMPPMDPSGHINYNSPSQQGHERTSEIIQQSNEAATRARDEERLRREAEIAESNARAAEAIRRAAETMARIKEDERLRNTPGTPQFEEDQEKQLRDLLLNQNYNPTGANLPGFQNISYIVPSSDIRAIAPWHELGVNNHTPSARSGPRTHPASPTNQHTGPNMRPLSEGPMPTPDILWAIEGAESGHKMLRRNKAGAIGLMQVTEDAGRDAARRLGIPFDLHRLSTDPEYNRMLGAEEFRWDLEKTHGNRVQALAAYNSGIGALRRELQKYHARHPGEAMDDQKFTDEYYNKGTYGRHPHHETRDYIKRIDRLMGGEILHPHPNIDLHVNPNTERERNSVPLGSHTNGVQARNFNAEIHVHGSNDPEETANLVLEGQNRVYRDMLRNMKTMVG